jgi:hypothetical protein
MDMIRLIVNRSLALREGLDETRALTLGMVGAMIGPPVTGYVVTMALARREAPEPVAAGSTTGELPPTPADGIAPGDFAAVGADAARRTRNTARAGEKPHTESEVPAAPLTAPADTVGTASAKVQPATKG